MKYPVLVTRGNVIFPGHTSILDVGRKASLNALNFSSVSYENQLIIVSQKNVMEDEITNASQFYNVGTLVKYTLVNEYPNGTKNISVAGVQRVSLSKITFSKGQMIEADVKILKTISASEVKEQAFVNQISTKIDSLLGGMVEIPKNILSTLASGISAAELADVIGHYLPLTLGKKQSLLEELDINKRLEMINNYIFEEAKVSEVEKEIEDNVKKTLNGQQREYLLRERLRAIKEELGDISSKDKEIDMWREEIENKKFPKYVKEMLLDEIKKFESMPPISAESHVIKGYIEWIFKLPWNTYSEDNDDLEKAKKILDKHHYGLKKVKERMIEHLAVKINTKNNSAPILTLVGPPGVGKTSLGKSIAEAVDREFVKVSLGGVRDESEIRGHRRTYVGAMPGKIIQAFKKAKTSNPVILLDEIDKMASDFRGDPTSAMLEVLDPEQNQHFQDHYLELEYDLSKVMFIGTANYYEQIPTPLLDRVELIFLDQYTSDEKLAIAKNYIIPKVLKQNGLKKGQFKIADTTIAFVIAKYTQEAGVRQLQRVISKIARKLVVKKIKGNLAALFTLTKDVVKELLGKEEIFKEVMEGKSEVGLVNGMYYSPAGGGVLPIEVTTYASKTGAIKLTGSIKDVMQESLQIAIAYIRSNEKKFGINFEWEKNTIQVHVPSGSTPKDGPSAGTAFTTAVISALKNQPISRNISFTGEITLRGKVLPIGGLKVKTIGSVEYGIRTIFIPKTNEKDLDDIPKKIASNVKIITVESYEEIFKKLFKK
ncbi:MAG: endopeptidase La [Mycoplasmataceae bacterium]|nr:endopeptidase La [Mycoplasmataceae bacterium]